MCGTMKGQNGWRSRTNNVFQVVYIKPNIITNKSKKTRWAGQLERMSDDRTVKKVLLGKPDGSRKAGRPK
jgi:hypothetical protein